MLMLIIVIHYYTYYGLHDYCLNFITKHNEHCCAYSLYTSQISSYS